MRKFIDLKFISFILVVVMLTVTINGVHEGAHAMQGNVKASNDQAPLSQVSVPHQYPCAPLDQHKDYDGCGTCINCVCHAPLAVKAFKLSYSPTIMRLSSSDSFTFLLEVYLTKFIPPQIHA